MTANGSLLTTPGPLDLTVTPPPGFSLAFWNRVLDAVRRQESNSNYGVSYLPATGTPEAVGRAAASRILGAWVQRLGGLIPALAKYGACGAKQPASPSDLPTPPCGAAYAAAVSGLLAGTPFASATAPASAVPTPNALAARAISGLGSAGKWVVLLLVLTVLALGVAGLRGKRPQQIAIVPEVT